MSAISSTRSAVLQGQGSIPCAKVEQSVTLCFVVPFRVWRNRYCVTVSFLTKGYILAASLKKRKEFWAMDSFSISFTLGKGSAPHGGNIRHNNRDYYADNVQKNNTALNVEYKRQDIIFMYTGLFRAVCFNSSAAWIYYLRCRWHLFACWSWRVASLEWQQKVYWLRLQFRLDSSETGGI